VLASRVRLARNLADSPYPQTASPDEHESTGERVLAAVRDELSPEPFGADSLEIAPSSLSSADRRFLTERSIFDHAGASRALVTADERLAIEIGGVDHVRIASIQPGAALSTALERVRSVDLVLERRLNYAVAMDWGYLSSEVTNLGTAMRASVLVHVPALALLGRLETMSSSMENSGYELVPFFPDESFDSTDDDEERSADDLTGSRLCLLRNVRTLGFSEETIVSKLEDYTSKLVHYERAARDELKAARGAELADSANRAFGILRFARSLSAVEARSLVSHLRLGIVSGLVSNVAVETVTTLLLINQDSHMARSRAREGDGDDIDMVRARVFREMLAA
jgi:protein arginine kinase